MTRPRSWGIRAKSSPNQYMLPETNPHFFDINETARDYYMDAFKLKTQNGARRIVDLLPTINDAD